MEDVIAMIGEVYDALVVVRQKMINSTNIIVQTLESGEFVFLRLILNLTKFG